MQRALLAAALGAACVSLAPPAFANGRFPASNRILLSRSDANVVVVRATYGLLVSRDGGASWSWLCEDVLGIPPTSVVDPPVELTGGGDLVIGPAAVAGLVTSPDFGCSLLSAAGPLSTQLVKDLVVRPDQPDVVLAVTSTYDPHADPDGGGGFVQQIYESVDDGMTWSAFGAAVDPTVVVSTIEVAASDPHRLYLSAVRGSGDALSGVLLVSTDDGVEFVEHDLGPLASGETDVLIAGVDPQSADLVYLRTAGGTSTPSRLLVTSDAGATVVSALTLTGPMPGFALSPDGSKVFLGGPLDGLQVGSRGATGFVRAASLPVECLAAAAGALWACSDGSRGFVAGVSTDDGATFRGTLELVSTPVVSCAADAAGSQCGGTPLAAMCLLLGCPDAGSDAGATAGHASSSSSKGCGCEAAGGGSAPTSAAMAGLLGAGAVVRRRRGRSRGAK